MAVDYAPFAAHVRSDPFSRYDDVVRGPQRLELVAAAT